jgi:hypothetical protein
MNGRFQMQGGKNWILTEIDQCKPVLLGLSLAGNLVKPLLSLYETEWRDPGYGLSKQFLPISFKFICGKLLPKTEGIILRRQRLHES